MQDRIKKCVVEGYSFLDLHEMQLFDLPEIDDCIACKLECLILSNNNLQSIPEITNDKRKPITCSQYARPQSMCSSTYFGKLTVLDISHNRLASLKFCNNTLEEIDCSDNSITDIDLSGLPSLKRLDCSNNSIVHFPQNSSLEILDCSYNNIISLHKIINVKKLICDFNKIEHIDYCHNIEELLCSNNRLIFLPICNKASYIDCSDNNIKKIDYLDSLLDMICDYDDNLDISTEYTISSCTIKKKKGKKYVFIYFSR